MNGKDRFHPQKAHGQRCFLRSHGVVSPNRENGHLGPIQVANQLHVAEDRGIAGVVEDRASRNGQDKSCRDSHVMDAGIILRRRRVFGLDHGGRHIVHLYRSAEIHADGVSHALSLEIGCQLIDSHHGGMVFRRHRHNIGDMIPVAMSRKDIVNLLRQYKILWVLGIACNKRVDQDIRALGGLHQHGGVSQPGDACTFQVHDGPSS